MAGIRIGIIAEGEIDHELLPSLLHRIACDEAGFEWPIPTEDVSEQLQIRKKGQGGVLESVRRLVSFLQKSTEFNHSFYVILLDYKTQVVQKEIKRLISGKNRFVLGVAIREIEAWWLGDRDSTLSWLKLNFTDIDGLRYAVKNYKAEGDDNPKKTLDELTRKSNVLETTYGDGNLSLAREFAILWKETARIRDIEGQCPKGFKKFCRKATNAFKNANASLGRLL